MIDETCKCGHHRDTHFKRAHNCLGMACDCLVFRDRNSVEPSTERTPFARPAAKPHVSTHCYCAGCLEYAWGAM